MKKFFTKFYLKVWSIFSDVSSSGACTRCLLCTLFHNEQLLIQTQEWTNCSGNQKSKIFGANTPQQHKQRVEGKTLNRINKWFSFIFLFTWKVRKRLLLNSYQAFRLFKLIFSSVWFSTHILFHSFYAI